VQQREKLPSPLLRDGVHLGAIPPYRCGSLPNVARAMTNVMPEQTLVAPMLPRYVRAEQLLEILFEPESKPSLRWLRQQQQNRTVPFVKVGRFVLFDPPAVKASLDARTIRPRGAR
jgi:hypothetical protein